MPYNEIAAAREKTHSLNMDGRERLSLSGIEDVAGFDENTIVLMTTMGALSIHGEQLHIEKVDLEQGRMEVRGHFSDLSYAETGGGGFWSRLFG